MKAHDKLTMTVTMQVTPAQALALQAMFDYWTQLGAMGSSREVGFYCDGDGNFRPKCQYLFSAELPELTAEMRKSAIIRDNNGDRLYDYDPIAWKVRDYYGEKEQKKVEGTLAEPEGYAEAEQKWTQTKFDTPEHNWGA